MLQTMLATPINWLAVLAAGVSTMVVGYVWYGPLFAKAWSALTGWTEEKVRALGSASMARQYGFTFLLALFMSFIMAHLLKALGVESIVDGALTGLVVGLGFVATAFGTVYLFERQSPKLYGINVGYQLVIMVVVAIILTAWK